MSSEQHREIDALNDEYAGRFRVFKGIEANILADGTLDVQPDERDVFEFVVASPHSLLRRDRRSDRPDAWRGARRWRRRSSAIRAAGCSTAARASRRTGTACSRRPPGARVAVELDGNWHRQDIDYELARRALDAGCIFALDSDAHAIGELRFSDYAIAHARLARSRPTASINCWSNEELDAWMEERRAPARQPR